MTKSTILKSVLNEISDGRLDSALEMLKTNFSDDPILSKSIDSLRLTYRDLVQKSARGTLVDAAYRGELSKIRTHIIEFVREIRTDDTPQSLELEAVLSIKSKSGIIFTSDIRIYDEKNDNLLRSWQITSTGITIDLGILSDLRFSHLLVDVIAKKTGSKEIFTYKMSYGEDQVESYVLQPTRETSSTLFFAINFSFCPRSPFC